MQNNNDSIEKLQERLQYGSKDKQARITLAALFQDFHCVSDVIGNDFEVFDAKGKLVYRVRKKPITVEQLQELINMFALLKKEEQKQSKKKGR